MKVTKLEHSGIIVEENDKLVVFDSVEFTEKLPECAALAPNESLYI